MRISSCENCGTVVNLNTVERMSTPPHYHHNIECYECPACAHEITAVEGESELTEFLKGALAVSVEQNTVFGPEEEIVVKLELLDEVISESSCTLPNQVY